MEGCEQMSLCNVDGPVGAVAVLAKDSESINLCRYRRLTLLTLVSRDSVPISAVFSCKIRHPEILESFKVDMTEEVQVVLAGDRVYTSRCVSVRLKR